MTASTSTGAIVPSALTSSRCSAPVKAGTDPPAADSHEKKRDGLALPHQREPEGARRQASCEGDADCGGIRAISIGTRVVARTNPRRIRPPFARRHSGVFGLRERSAQVRARVWLIDVKWRLAALLIPLRHIAHTHQFPLPEGVVHGSACRGIAVVLRDGLEARAIEVGNYHRPAGSPKGFFQQSRKAERRRVESQLFRLKFKRFRFKDPERRLQRGLAQENSLVRSTIRIRRHCPRSGR